MEQRAERIVVETDRYRMTATVTLPAEGYGSRLTDHLNAANREFLACTDVEIVPLDDEGRHPPSHHDYLALGRRHIVFATSAETP